MWWVDGWVEGVGWVSVSVSGCVNTFNMLIMLLFYIVLLGMSRFIFGWLVWGCVLWLVWGCVLCGGGFVGGGFVGLE